MSRKPQITEEGKQAFLNLAGQDGEIDAFELQGILNKAFVQDFKFDGFSVDMTRGLVAARDADLSGKLDFNDFQKLWSDLALCKKAFQVLDSDNSGYFSRTEFNRALEVLGMTASEGTLKAMMTRYSDKDGTVHFDDFVACYIKLKTMQKAFRAKGGEPAEFGIDEYVQLSIYA